MLKTTAAVAVAVAVAKRYRYCYYAHLCVASTTLLLLLSLFLLHSRLSFSSHPHSTTSTTNDNVDFDTKSTPFLDRIVDLDDDDDDYSSNLLNQHQQFQHSPPPPSSAYYFDHVSRVFRLAVDSRSVDDVQPWTDYVTPFVDFHDLTKVAFGSDDMPLEEEMKRKLVKVNGIEDALLLKLGSNFSPLREGWGGWFDAKSDFLRRDRMFKSKLELLNPVNNPLLQDPDGFGVTGLTRGDKLVQKWLINAMKKAPSIVKKFFVFSDTKYSESHIDNPAKGHDSMNDKSLDRSNAGQEFHAGQETEVRRSDNTALDDVKYNALGGSAMKAVYDRSLWKSAENLDATLGKIGEEETQKVANSIEHSKLEQSNFMHASGSKWGYFPSLHPYLSFSNFMDSFFRKWKCSMRVFMVWNSPPWMYTVRHQRGLESLLFHHPDACVVVFSETIELDFFKEFQKDGFKVAVAMPNLEELLKDTPTSIFASIWHEWRVTKYYSTHYSELIRLAALYKYGGIYLDCDIVVLKPISAFGNSVGMEDLADGNPLNGAVMAFSKNSFFILQCLLEFVSSYDDTLLRWNGADLLTRVAGNLSSKAQAVDREKLLKVQSASIFFPIGSHDIHRYFIAPVTDSEKAHQHAVLKKILEESYTFHFWNSVTSALVPEPYSLVAQIMTNFCIRCLDQL